MSVRNDCMFSYFVFWHDTFSFLWNDNLYKLKEMKTTAVITPSDKEFRMYALTQNVTEKETEFIHVSNLNQCYGLEINDYVSITNKAKLSNLNEIEKELIKRILKQ